MAENTKIEWAHHTFNPWIGCTKVSPACYHCYAEVSTPSRTMHVGWGTGQSRVRTSPGNWKLPERWNAKAERLGVRYRVFCASLADVFDNEVPTQWRIELMSLILQTPHLDWLLLTKRIGNAAAMLETAFRAVHHQREGWADNVPSNVWIGATICNQAEADRDIPKLLRVPAAKRFLSIEPLLGAVKIDDIKDPDGAICLKPLTGIRWVSLGGDQTGCKPQSIGRVDWVIVGGESGHQARPMHPDWARSLRDQCEAAGVPFLFKQWGEWGAADQITDQTGDSLYTEDLSALRVKYIAVGLDGRTSFDADLVEPGGATLYRVGKKAAGRLLDGRPWDGVPS